MPARLSLQGVLIVGLVAGALAVPFLVSLEGGATTTGELKTFSSRQELLTFVEEHLDDT